MLIQPHQHASDHSGSPRRCIRPGAVALDPREPLLIVQCMVKSTTTGSDGRVRVEEIPQQRAVRIPRMPAGYDDCVAMAEELVSTSKYLARSQQSEIEQLLYQLHQRGLLEQERLAAQQAMHRNEEIGMEHLESYLEPLYDHDGGPAADAAKVQGTATMLELARDAGNIEALVQDPALLGALARVLADDAPRGSASPALLYNVLRLLLVFSNFYEMHELLAEHRIGSLTMRVLELELHKGPDTRPRSPPQRGHAKIVFACTHVLFNLAANVTTEEKVVRRGLVPLLLPLLGHTWPNLVLLAARFLAKLSIYEENIAQMRAHQAAARLVPWLPCPSHDAITAAALALAQNLAFDPQLRADLIAHGAVPKLVALLGEGTPSCTSSSSSAAAAATQPSKPSAPFRGRALRLLYQLSSDTAGRAALSAPDAGLVPVVKEMVLGWPRSLLPEDLAALAVNLSWDPRAAEAFCHKAGLRRLVDRALRHRDPLLLKVVQNISQWSLGVQAALEDPDAEYDLRCLWPSHAKLLAALALELGGAAATATVTSQGLLVEVLGTLGNLTPLDLPIGTAWRELLGPLQARALVDLCVRLLLQVVEADVVLKAVCVVQALALDGTMAADMAQAGVVRALHAAWQRHSNSNDDGEATPAAAEEPELALQVLVAWARLLHHGETRAALMAEAAILDDVAAAAGHANAAVRAAARVCVGLVIEVDGWAGGGDVGERLCRRRFEAHNRAWLEAVATAAEAQGVAAA